MFCVTVYIIKSNLWVDVVMKKCLLVCGYFFPAFKSGGPVRSATNLVKLLKDDVVFDVYTSDRDMGDDSSFPNVNLNSWDNKYLTSNVFYKSPGYSLISNFKKTFKTDNYDVIYLNSFFDLHFSIVFSIFASLGMFNQNKIMLAPRGELTHGAMSLKHFKKCFFLSVFKAFGIHKRITFHFTSEQEVRESLSYLGNVKYKLVPNMHSEFPEHKLKDKAKGSLNIIFLSRISPKKNLTTIIKSLMNINAGCINFTIAGEVDDALYWGECISLLEKCPPNININVLGSIGREQVGKELGQAHLFFLPTLNENYGHAIVEAMMYSNIVMLSDQTPWSQVKNHGGYVGNVNDVEFYTQSIVKLLRINQDEFNRKTKGIYEYSLSILKRNETLIKKMFD